MGNTSEASVSVDDSHELPLRQHMREGLAKRYEEYLERNGEDIDEVSYLTSAKR